MIIVHADEPGGKRKRIHKPVVERIDVSWRYGYPWVQKISTSKSGGHAFMICTTCSTYAKDSSWGIGSGSVVKDQSCSKRHEESSTHCDSVDKLQHGKPVQGSEQCQEGTRAAL